MKSAVLSFVPATIAPAVCAAAVAVCLLTFAFPARAASLGHSPTGEALTSEQLSNVQQLLASYGVDEAKIKAVSAVLTNESDHKNSACGVPGRALVRGMRSDDVTVLQQRLSDAGFLSSDDISGFFGPMTEMALKQWQADQGIVATGTPETTGWGAVGKKTIAALSHCSPNRGQEPEDRGEDGTTTPSMAPMRHGPMFPGGSGTPVPSAAPAAPQAPAPQGVQSSAGSAMQFVADYSDAFNQNLAAVAAAPYKVYVPMLSNFFTSIGL